VRTESLNLYAGAGLLIAEAAETARG